jgi:hypothetical protein
MAPKRTALALATAALLVAFDSDISTTGAATAQINVGGETVIDDVVRYFDQDDGLGLRSAISLAVNGRVVAVHDELSAVSTNKWNWTFLLIGSAGLVVAQLARRRSRRGDFLALNAVSSADRG